ncbi:phytoene dehydrogenase [Winogradskyella sp. PC-19]|uniref:1-hydroxycarotenoid 3,4-desaturase CrtD n=1 Tax=unclassified Winogradskyella TaxID=2615021 RepID=UPI000B3C61F5|nr:MULTISPECIES: 1-hydroxycarotenoid 3,4-desaturase CrtD [unclassified Winogradskyella]ARV10626.1 phytoene dehydrogenase [Winogradskyella sp. PC-19]RZN81005.1 MAG: phytoene desaturase [Winogradskyella sp.]
MKQKSVIIVGAGIAGISAAIRLRCQGHNVSVYEANNYPGGKLTAFSENGYRFDMGPSLFTMPQFVEDLFKTANTNISDYFQYKKKDVVCNYFYEDGTTFSAVSDEDEFAKKAEQTFDIKAEDIKEYFKQSKKKYDLTASLFLEKSLHKVITYLSKGTLKAIFNINSLDIDSTLDTYNSKMLKDNRLVQFFNRFATYNGSSPYQTPGIMSMIPHLEQYFGTYFPKGGMHQITLSLFKLATDIGVDFTFDTKVEEIITKNNKVVGVGTKLKDKTIKADIVVSNSDVVPTYRYLLKKHKAPEKILQQPRSSSALIFYWGIKKEFPQLDLHNIFFSEDYKTEFDYIFNKKNVSDDPTVYINITSKEEESDAPKGHENWFTMVNVPSNIGQDWDKIIKETRVNIISKLSRLLGEDISDLIEFESILDPRTIESRTQSFQGALYGASSNNKYAAFLRHPNFKSSIKNLYFCGGSVHPGGGIPLCLLSGKIVSELIKKNN